MFVAAMQPHSEHVVDVVTSLLLREDDPSLQQRAAASLSALAQNGTPNIHTGRQTDRQTDKLLSCAGVPCFSLFSKWCADFCVCVSVYACVVTFASVIVRPHVIAALLQLLGASVPVRRAAVNTLVTLAGHGKPASFHCFVFAFCYWFIF